MSMPSSFSLTPWMKKFDVEIVHLGSAKDRLAEAERAGVKSVPALVIDGAVYHINYGAALMAPR